MYYNPAQMQESSHQMTPDGYNQVSEVVDSGPRSFEGVNSFGQYPPGFGNFPTPGVSMEPETATFPLNTRPPLIREWVPQVRYGVRANGGRRFNGELPITFAIGDQAGMSLHDAINERYEGLVGRDDEMFTACECTAISLRIQWPGCEPWARHINTRDWRKERVPITRSKLAHKIAKIVDRFIELNEGLPEDEEYWRVGTGHIELKHLILDRIEHVTKGSWQPQIFVVRPGLEHPI